MTTESESPESDGKLYRVSYRIGDKDDPPEKRTKECYYCGPDRLMARITYHEYSVIDKVTKEGIVQETLMEVIEDAGTDDFSDDVVTRC